MFDCSQFRSLIIEPVLSKMQVYSKDAEEILVFTCAAESLGGHYLIHYLRVAEKIPVAGDLDAMWDYYKKYYNTSAGKANKEHSIKKYQEFIKS